ncbi:hypothetical protein ACHAQA_007227 [Verticillium albo-atrum]
MAPVVFIPLYIYPFETAWEPLRRAARAHPSLNFVAVINPGNGPGPDPRPDASYVAALHRLCALPNIQLLGYVHVTYCTRDPAAVQRDIAVYRAWNDEGKPGSEGGEGEKQDAFRLEGIFFDETPWDPCHQPYMASLARFARDAWRAGGLDRHAVLAYNPGVVVEPRWYDDADYVVVFEQSARHWATYFESQGLPQIPASLRPKAVAVVHTCSGGTDAAGAADAAALGAIAHAEGQGEGEGEGERDSASEGENKNGGASTLALAERISGLGFGGVYLTDELDGGYTRWPAMWEDVLERLVSSMTTQQQQQQERGKTEHNSDNNRNSGRDQVQGQSVRVRG